MLTRVVLAVVAMTAVVGLLAGCQRTRQAPPPSPAQQQVNRERAMALAFYKAVYLEQDPAAGWAMLHPTQQKKWHSVEEFKEIFSGNHRLDTPADLKITEKRRPQERYYRYLFESSLTDPVIVEVYEDSQGGLSILEDFYSKHGGAEL